MEEVAGREGEWDVGGTGENKKKNYQLNIGHYIGKQGVTNFFFLHFPVYHT